MTLKHKNSPLPPVTKSVEPDAWSGPWGRINPTSASCEVVRFAQGTRAGTLKTHSYPYRVISSWHWAQDTDQEHLRIEAGADTITVQGRRLDRIVDALDQGTLELLCEEGGDFEDRDQTTWISRMEIQSHLDGES